MPTDLILGTAGHIDHGKSALIRALTGRDTDRLPEEKRRGITIDLGFAELPLGEYRLGIVDVPGHERFVRNMLAGATGMDLALLVVAADDSVKPQTVEHLEILKLLELPAGVIAVTKADLVSSEWLDLVEDEVRELVSGTFLEDAPLVATSVTTGQGLDQLKRHLAAAAQRAARSRADRFGAAFRMPIDRAFTIHGHGVVVTGSVSSGHTSVGDELEIQPGGRRVRVRGLQVHDRSAETVQRGQRAAINLSGGGLESLARGRELAQPGHLVPTRLLTVRLQLSPHARPLKNRSRCRIHLGADEVLGRVRLLLQDRLEPGNLAWAQLYLERECVAVWRQPFVLRSESPVTTLGGGLVVDPQPVPLKKPGPGEQGRLEQLLSPDPSRRAESAWYFLGLRDRSASDLYRLVGIEDPELIVEQLRLEGILETVPLTITRRQITRSQFVHRAVLDRVWRRVETSLTRLHDTFPLRTSFPSSAVRHAAGLGDAESLFTYLIGRARQAGLLRVHGERIGLASRGPQLSRNEARLLEQLVLWYREAGLAPPTIGEMQARAAHNQASTAQLIMIAAENGDLVQLGEDLYLHAEVDRQAREKLAATLQEGEGITVSRIRELLETTRKYAVPYCEYLDRMEFTRRDGDVRYLALPPETTSAEPGEANPTCDTTRPPAGP